MAADVFVFDSVKEDVFWRNYFYRVSLIKQSAQLTALAAQQQQQKDSEDRGTSVSPEDIVLTGQTSTCALTAERTLTCYTKGGHCILFFFVIIHVPHKGGRYQIPSPTPHPQITVGFFSSCHPSHYYSFAITVNETTIRNF